MTGNGLGTSRAFTQMAIRRHPSSFSRKLTSSPPQPKSKPCAMPPYLSSSQPVPLPSSSSSILSPLPAIKPQPPLLRLKSNHTPLGKEEDIALRRLDTLPALIRNFKVTIHDDLHLVIGIGVDERGARVEAVEARGDGVVFAAATY